MKCEREFATLFEMYKIHSPSHKEVEMSQYIQNHLTNLGVSFEVDKFGQVYSIKEGTPILSAHMDQVQKSAPTHIILIGDFVYGFRGHRQTGLGADDKNGIYIILKMLEEVDQNSVSFIFSSGEESGGHVGSIPLSRHPYCLVLDRKGSGDIIGTSNRYCCGDFQDVLTKIGNSFGFNPQQGLFSDADNISNHVPCVNLSVGYYSAHTEYEYTDLRDIRNTLQFVREILVNVPRIDYTLPEKKYTRSTFNPLLPFPYKGSSRVSKHWYDDFDEFDDLFEIAVDQPTLDFPIIRYEDTGLVLTGGGVSGSMLIQIPLTNQVVEVSCGHYDVLIENINGHLSACVDLSGEFIDLDIEYPAIQ